MGFPLLACKTQALTYYCVQTGELPLFIVHSASWAKLFYNAAVYL
jgi:hypothetical protein